jgi:hypothetical protein
MNDAESRARWGVTRWGPAAALLVLASVPGKACAYLDPGTGSYLFQLAIAGILSALFLLRQALRRVADTLRRYLPGRRSEGSPPGDDLR